MGGGSICGWGTCGKGRAGAGSMEALHQGRGGIGGGRLPFLFGLTGGTTAGAGAVDYWGGGTGGGCDKTIRTDGAMNGLFCMIGGVKRFG